MPQTAILKVSRFPHGFYEQEMFEYFRQFGTVLKVKVFRSFKTGGSKHVAFVLFEDESVAKIAAETMDNYLMFNKLMKCEVIPSSEVDMNVFKHWEKKPLTREQIIRLRINKHSKELTDAEILMENQRSYQFFVKRNKMFADRGIDYQFNIPPPPQLDVILANIATAASDAEKPAKAKSTKDGDSDDSAE